MHRDPLNEYYSYDEIVREREEHRFEKKKKRCLFLTLANYALLYSRDSKTIWEFSMVKRARNEEDN